MPNVNFCNLCRGLKVTTKILCVFTSTGVTGNPIQLTANFFRILSRPQWVLYQYHVDFKPQMESRRLRSALLFQHEETLGSARSFDGALLFLPNRLHSKVLWCSKRRVLWRTCLCTQMELPVRYHCKKLVSIKSVSLYDQLVLNSWETGVIIWLQNTEFL